MNKKFLICGALAAGLLLTACVKKEAPKEDEQEQVENAASESQPAAPAQFEKLEDASQNNAEEEIPAHTAEVIREETANTTTEIRREPIQPAAEAPKPEAPKAAPAPKAETPKPEETAAAPAPKKSNAAQSEDDAVAAAIAAATPALDK